MSNNKKRDTNVNYSVEIKKNYLCLIEEDDSNKTLYFFSRYNSFCIILKLKYFL